MFDLYTDMILPQIHKISKQIDNDIRVYIKQEIKEQGSIVKRYGDWAKFINQEIDIIEYEAEPGYLFHKVLLYRGKKVKDYCIEL